MKTAARCQTEMWGNTESDNARPAHSLHRATESLGRVVTDVIDAVALATILSCFAAPFGAFCWILWCLFRPE